MTIPAKASFNMITTLVGKASNDVLDGAGQDMTIMRETSGKRRSVVEGVPD